MKHYFERQRSQRIGAFDPKIFFIKLRYLTLYVIYQALGICGALYTQLQVTSDMIWC